MANAWMRFMAECRRRYGNDAWDVPADGALPTDDMYVRARLRSWNRPLLYFTKWAVASCLDKFEEEVREADYWIRYGLPTQESISGFAPIAKPYGSLRFIGDLDPCDLAQFRALECGSPQLVRRRGWKLPIVYAGVSSAWIELSNDWKPVALERNTIRMDRLEMRQYRALRDSWPALPEVIGEQAMNLLEGGRKLEVEGALVFRIHDPGFRKALLDILFGESERRATLRVLRSGDANTARAAADAFRPNEREQEALRRLVTAGDAAVHNQVAALRALRNAEPPVEAESLAGWVVDRDIAVDVRAEAGATLIDSLQKVDRRGRRFQYVARSLIEALSEGSPAARYFAASVLGAIRAKSALPELRRLAASDRSRVPGWGTVARQARDSIAHIETGEWPKGSRTIPARRPAR